MARFFIEEKTKEIVRLVINRPDARNAISQGLAEEFYELLDKYGADPDVRALVIIGSGDKAFCAGADLKERKVMTPQQRWTQTLSLQRFINKIETIPIPVIAAIRGFCLGGGLETALACDIRIASETAVFSFPEMTLGAFPGSGGPVRLTRVVGMAAAKEMLMTARKVGAEEALRIGLVQRLVPDARLEDEAAALCEEIKKSTKRGVAAVKKITQYTPEMSLETALAYSNALREPMDGSADYDAGIRTFFAQKEADKQKA